MPIDKNALAGTLAVIIANKGGVAKSTTSLIIGAVAENNGMSVCFIDSDSSNSSTAQVHVSTQFVDISKVDSSGDIMVVIENLAEGRFDCAVWDTGARAEETVYEILELIRPLAQEKNVPIIIVKPITTNHFVQGSAVDSIVFAKRNGFAVLFATILAQGRKKDDFADWYASAGRKTALEYAVEFDVDSMGAVIPDNASSFSMSLTDVALGRFNNVPESYRNMAITKFSRSQQMFLAAYLLRMGDRILPAVSEARSRLAMPKAKKNNGRPQ